MQDTITFQYRKHSCSANDWNKKYRDGDYPILGVSKDGASVKEITFAYMAVGPSTDLLCSADDLAKVRDFCAQRNLWPRPNIKVIEKVATLEKPTDDIGIKTLF